MPLKLQLHLPSSTAPPLMASISSLLLPNSKPHRDAFVPPNPNPRKYISYRTLSCKLSDQNSTESTTEKKSFGVATGEFFISIASRLIKKKNPNVEVLSSERFSTTIPRDALDIDVENFVERRNRDGVSSSFVEDTVDPGMIWEQQPKDVEAERKRRVVSSPGFSFSAAGLILPYHFGVAQCLIEKGYIKETTPLAGSSAGAIASAVIASGINMQDALKATKELAADCRDKGTAFRLGALMRDILTDILPDDIHLRASGRIRVAITQILWRPKGLLVDHFDSKEDLVNALFTSSFIPGYLAPRPATFFRNRLCIDGGLTLFMPPTSASKTIRVCAFPASRLRLEGIGISPECNPENIATPRQLLNWALEPAEDHILDRLYEFGYLDAAVWAEQNPVELTVQHDRAETAEEDPVTSVP